MSKASAQALDETLAWTLRTSVAIKSDDARQEAAVSKLRGSVDAFMPKVSYVQERILSSKISYSPDYIVPTEAGLDSTARREPNAAGFQASLSLFDGLKRYNDFRSAKLGVESGKVLQVEKRQQILLDTSSAYLAVIRDRKIVELRRKQVSDISTIAVRTKARFSVRDATLTDVDIAESRVLAALVAMEQAMADLTSSNIDFERITGTQPQTLVEPQVPDNLIPKTVQEVQALVLQINPKLQAARLDATAAGFQAKAQIAEMLPQVNLVASHMKQTNISDALNNATDSTVKIQLRVPLYEPGALPRIYEADAVARQKSWDAIDSQKQGAAAATSLFLGRLSTINQLDRTMARVHSMQKAVDGYRIEQSAGFRTIIDILNARNELTEAQVTKANLEFARDRQTFTLAAALARLGTTGVSPPTTSAPVLISSPAADQQMATATAVQPVIVATATSMIAAAPLNLAPASPSQVANAAPILPGKPTSLTPPPVATANPVPVAPQRSKQPTRTAKTRTLLGLDTTTFTPHVAGQAVNFGRFIVTSVN